VTGVHVPPRSPERIAEALRDLLGDPRRREQLGAAAARRAKRYSWASVADATLRAYSTVLQPAARVSEAVL
jgi:glycosyltransferase involved in cell wall biosynthesis